MLPKVHADICFSVSKSLTEINEEFKIIQEENPIVAQLIEDWALYLKRKDDQIHCLFAGIMVYKLLKSQAEVDEMEREIKII